MQKLFQALAAFQQEVPPIHKNAEGYGYNYAPLEVIIPTIKPYLEKHKIGFTQLIQGEQIETIIFHYGSGEFLKSFTNIPQNVKLKGMNDFQVLGSAISYLRRYSLEAALGITTSKDKDACGEQEPPEPPKEPKKTPPKKAPQQTEQPEKKEKIKDWSAALAYAAKSKANRDEILIKKILTKEQKEALEKMHPQTEK